MHVLVINPNSTEAMTRSIGAAAHDAARAETAITALNPADTPPAIQGPEDGAAALPGLFRLFDEEVLGKGGYDACIIACFDDTGLDAVRCMRDEFFSEAAPSSGSSPAPNVCGGAQRGGSLA